MKIGDEFGLDISQIGELDAQIRWVLRGQAQTTTFSADIQTLLDITPEKARMITNKINADVFEMLQKLTTAHDHENSLQAIEKAGGFEIERPMANIPVRKSLNLLEEEGDVTSMASEPVVEEKRDIVAGLENPTPATFKPADSTPTPQPAPAQQYPKKEPLVEQLLRGSTASPAQKVVHEAPMMPTKRPTITVPPRPAGGDPYRESIE
jgi:hypothetical protein